MSERDQILLYALDDMADQAAEFGLCRAAFTQLKREVLRIMGERDGWQQQAEVNAKGASDFWSVEFA